MEDPEWWEIVACLKHGMSWEVATTLDPLYRLAFYYSAAQCEGYTVDWKTGRLIDPE